MKNRDKEPKDPAGEKMFSTKAVADTFGVTTETVRNWIATGRLSATRLPTGQWRVRQSDLEAFARSNYESTSPTDEGSEAFI